MTNSERKNREKILAIVTIIVVLGALAFSIIIEPQLAKRKKSLEEMYQLQLKLTKMRTDVRMKDRTDNIYSVYEPVIASIGNDAKDLSVFARELRNLYNKLEVKNMSINPIIKEEFFKQLSMKIEVSGKIQDILSFILEVERYKNPIHIERMDIISHEITDTVKATFVITKVVAEANT
ncbi:MAG: hypothetical protein JXA96_16805 [Sedimentisphaerales bacterium]|nr:hypothetical protein [Sedimentisphaerales bacterium]